MSTTKTRSGTRLRGPLTVVLTLTLMSLLTSALTLSPIPSASAATGDTDFVFVFANGETFSYPDASYDESLSGGTWHLDSQRFVDAGVAASVEELPDEFLDRKVHVSCSEEFPDGYDSGSDGNFPLASLHAPDWEIVSYYILIPLGNGKECGETFEPGTVTVVKVTEPETTESFEFRLSGDESPCPGGNPVGCGGTVDDTQSVAGDGGSHTWTVNAGTYALEELGGPTDYVLDDVSCTGLDPGETADDFDIAGGEAITCTFSNVKEVAEGFVSVAKVVAGDESDVTSFTFTSPESFSLVDGETRTFGPYPVGTEVVFTEVDLGEDWMTVVGCGEGDPTETNSVTVTIVEGTVETAPVCTFTNTFEVPPPPPPEIDLAIDKTDFEASVVLTEENPTGEIAYRITVTNLGPDDATGVVVTDTLPDDVAFVSASPSQGSCSEAGGVVTCPLGGMAGGGGVATIDLVIEVGPLGEVTYPGGTVENLVVVDGNEEDVDPTNNEATEETPISEVFPLLLPQLSIDKVDTEDPIVLTEDDPDGRITYVVTVTNAADAGPATGVVVTDALPATVTFHSVVPEQGICSLAGQVLTCQVGDMAPGDVVDITITVDTESFGDLTVGTVTNVVEVLASEADEPGDNRAEETTDIAEVRDEEVLPETGFPSAALAVGGVGSILLGGLVLGLGRRLDRRS